MMELVRAWLLGITGAAILSALADGAMPEGGVKQAGKLVCGLVLLAAVLRPLGGIEVTNLSGQWEYDRQQLQQQLKEETDAGMKSVIEERMSAYSMDKAARLGVQCWIEVSCQMDENGVFLPVSAQIGGVNRPEERQAVEQLLSGDLGIDPRQLVFQEAGKE